MNDSNNPINDPYCDTSRCVARLLEQYETTPRLIIAVDFDDTVFNYHEQNFQYPRVIALLKRCQKLNFYIVVYTARRADNHWEIIPYMNKLGIYVNEINKNAIDLPYGNDGKIYYNILLDDRAGLGQACETLETVVNILEKRKSIK